MRPFVLFAGLSLSVPAFAADDDRSSKAFDTVAACRDIAVAADRLACFDRSVDAFAKARSRGDVVVVDRARVVERKRASFGLAMPSDDLFGGGSEDRATAVQQVDTTVRAAVAGKGGQYTLELANGSVWRTLDSPRFPPQAGQPVKLTTAPLGGFRASIAGRNSVLVKRTR